MNLAAVLEGADLSEDWLQGRTAFGGASAAIALNAAMTSATGLPPLRSAQIAFVGPLAGPVVVMPTLLRRGKNSAFIGCDVSSSEGIGLRALFLFMAARPSEIAFHDLPAPDFPIGSKRIDPVDVPQGFLRQFEFAPWQAANGVVRRWTRLNDRAGLDPTIELLAIADALPPAAMTLAKQWGPISTTTWQLNLITDAPATRDGWWLLEAKTLDAANGNSSQIMTIWNADGAAVATATQSVALFV